MTDTMSPKEAGFRKRHPTISAAYDMLPGYPDIPGNEAPVDQILKMIMGGLGQGSSGINPGVAAGQWGNSAISSLLSELGIGQPPAMASPSSPGGHDMFGNPVEPSQSIDTDPNSPNFGKSVTHYEPPAYPPPGVDPTEWALANPPQGDQALPPGLDDPNFVPGPAREYGVTPEDIQRWSEVLNSTTVTKQPEVKKQGPNTAPPAMPQKKPKPIPRAARPETWDTVITGLGGYAP